MWVGGVSEEGEAPTATALRECKEEIGVVPDSIRLAFVNYSPPQPTGQTDGVQFMFTCNMVEDDFINGLTLQASEIEDVRFVPVADLAEYLHDYRARAVQAYWAHRAKHTTLYMEDGLLM